MKKLFLPLLFVSLQAQGTELTDAMRKNDRQKVEQLLAQSPTIIDTPDSYGAPPLIYAVRFNNKELVQLLLDKRADVNAPNNDGQTALHLAVICNRKELVQLLLAKGADTNKPTNQGRTPLHSAVNTTNKELVKLLIENGADPFIAYKEGKATLDALLASIIYTPEEKQPLIQLLGPYVAVFKEMQQGPNYDTLLKVVEHGYPALVKQLLKKLAPGIRQVRQLSQLAHQRSAQTKNEAFKAIKRILTDYMHALMLAHAESPQPADMLHVIAGHTL
ncbi:ankyrin repeat domain-containing protein [Candidatus Dependentiae bacterium]|nr:ankyrin repeat domain-containing protein [Candidatus Dependentiae bacterium]